MLVDLNGLFLDYPNTGTWTYTRNLVSALVGLDGDLNVCLSTRRVAGLQVPAGIQTRRPRWPIGGSEAPWLERLDKLAWEQLAWTLAGRKSDLLHSLYFAAPVIRPAPLVVTVHDAISLLPENAHSKAAIIYANLMRRTVGRAAALITVSRHAQSEISRALDYPVERIFVTPEAADPSLCRVSDPDALSAVRRRYGLPGKYVLYLGGTERRKNLETLVRAWGEIRPDGVDLVIVGRFPADDALFPDIPRLVRELGLDRSVRFISSIQAGDLAAVYSAALAFCYPSTHEGFGLPPVEAMACGTPVLASDASSLPEVLGDGAALLPPDDVASWSGTLMRITEDPAWRDQLSRRGLARAKSYSWAKTAEMTMQVYRQVLGA